jgi:predicted DCC family thiol-disulfide oxidoreductase YuxK
MATPGTLPDPDRSPGTDVVIYDGDCRFCQGQVRNLRRLDCCGDRLSFISLHDPRVAQRYPDLSHNDLMAQMYVVDTNGNRHGGSEAVRYLTRRLPLLWPVMPILHLPGTAGLWRWGYRQVAKRRYKISGKNCDTDACSIHLNR